MWRTTDSGAGDAFLGGEAFLGGGGDGERPFFDGDPLLAGDEGDRPLRAPGELALAAGGERLREGDDDDEKERERERDREEPEPEEAERDGEREEDPEEEREAERPRRGFAIVSGGGGDRWAGLGARVLVGGRLREGR
jgi:hypothetical protein